MKSNVTSLFKKLKRSNAGGGKICYLVIQTDAIYLSEPEAKLTTPTKFDISEANWEQAYEQALSVAVGRYDSVSIILAHNHYQMYQLEKPSMPRNEWSAALPFLLKELISEKPNDIVADAIEIPNSNKVQVYVLHRQLLDRLLTLAKRMQLPVLSVVPEDELWGFTAGDLGSFLLIQYSHKGHYRVSAFIDHTLCFHRSIRSVTPPLTGVPSADFQMDSLSLELQRSIDYLAAQQRQVQLHQLKLSCDHEDEAELVQALSYRLSTKVASLVEDKQTLSGQVLADVALHHPEPRVDLYPEYLKPKKDRLSLKNIAMVWGAAAAIIFAATGYVTWENQGTSSEIEVVKSQGRVFKSEVDRFKEQLKDHKPDNNKLAAKARLEREVRTKRNSLQIVGQYDESQRIGYSGVMASLSKFGRQDISISEINIRNAELSLKGLARSPSAVPNWVGQFSSEFSLMGRTFDSVKLGRNEDDIVTFELTSHKEEVKKAL